MAPEPDRTTPEQRVVTPEKPVVKSTTEARQGVTGHNVRYVLWIALALIVLIFLALYLYDFA